MYLFVFFHELGHATAVISLGGTVKEFVVAWNMSGYVKWTYGDTPMASYPVMCTLVNVSGGIGAMLFFLALTHKSKWFTLPAFLCLIDGFSEALYLADTRFASNAIMEIAVMFICLGLFWKFETSVQDAKKLSKKENTKDRYRPISPLVPS
jgi:hypothetical protein